MVALLDDLAAVHDHDRVGVADRRETIGHYKARSPLAKACHSLLDEDLVACIDAARRLVEYEDARVGDKGPGDRHELLLTGGDVGGVLVDDGVVTVGLGPYEVVLHGPPLPPP